MEAEEKIAEESGGEGSRGVFGSDWVGFVMADEPTSIPSVISNAHKSISGAK
jgi:hypothetical protein